MEFLFTLICLGSPKLAIKYLTDGKMELTEKGTDFTRFGSIINSYSLESGEKNIYNLEINVAHRTDVSEQEILMSDGILFFTNPVDNDDLLILKEQLNYFANLKREIPVIVIFYNPNGLITKPVNKILASVWRNSLFEAFICTKFTENKLHEILPVICDSVANHTMILNPEYAWMRMPVLIEKANDLIFAQEFGTAAKYVELLSVIGKKFDFGNYLVWVEQAAWLYLQAQDYIQAVNLLKTYNPGKAKVKQAEYIKVLVEQGNILYKAGNYINAAEKYEFAAKWASFELNNSVLYKKIARSVILAYIAGNSFEKAFSTFQNFDNEEIREILKEIGPNVLKVSDSLITLKKYDIAKMQIYLCISIYQRYSVFDYINMMGEYLANALYYIFEREIHKGDPHSARLVLDEIVNLWDEYKVPKRNLDENLIKLGKLFMDIRDYPMVERLFPYIVDGNKQKELEGMRMDHEEQVKTSEVQTKIGQKKRISDALYTYSSNENRWIDHLLSDLFIQIDMLNERNDFQRSLEILNNYMKAIRKYRKKIARTRLLEKKWDTMVQSKAVLEFLREINKEEQDLRKTYLKKAKQDLIVALQFHFDKSEHENACDTTNKIIALYRSEMLYEDARELTQLLVNSRSRYLETRSSKKDDISIIKSIESVRDIECICDSYLDGIYPNFDEILKNISEYFFDKGNYLEARKHMEKIKNSKIKERISELIHDKEQELTKSKTDKVKETQILNLKIDHFSILKNLAQHAKNDKEVQLKSRSTLRKFFDQPIQFILEKDLQSAAREYFDTAKKLVSMRRYEASAVAMAVNGIINLILKDFRKMNEYIVEFSRVVASLDRIFEDIFPFRLLNFVNDMIQGKMGQQAVEALKLYYSLPLFEEEEIILGSLIEADTITNDLQFSDDKDESLQGKIKHLLSKLKDSSKSLDLRESLQARDIGTLKQNISNGSYAELSEQYYDNALEHIKMNDIASTCLILARLADLRYLKNQYEKNLEKWAFKNETAYNILKKNPEQMLIEIFSKIYQTNPKSTVGSEILSVLISNLPLFHWEKQFISTFKPNDLNQIDSKKINGECVNDTENVPNTLITDQMNGLSQKFLSNASKYNEIKDTREKMRSQYYNDILTCIAENKFDEAFQKYSSLAKRFLRRSNYELASLMIFLGGNALLKTEKKIDEINNEINNAIDGLGLTKSSIIEHEFYQLLKLQLDNAICGVKTLPELEKLKEKLPLIGEEQKILD